MSKIIREFIKVMEFFAIAFCIVLALHIMVVSLFTAYHLTYR